MASSQLLAAQKRLHQLRAEAAKQKHQDVPWEVDTAKETAVSITDLPAHLGWGSTAVAQTLRYAKARKEKVPSDDMSGVIRNAYCEKNHASRITYHVKKDSIPHHPSLGLAAMDQGEVPCYRVWLMCRYLDEMGRGAVNVTELKAQLTETESTNRMFSWKRLRQILYAGNGRFWHWNQETNRLWLVGVVKLANTLNVQKLTGQRVQLPIKTVTSGIGQFKAHLYGAWHSGRTSDKPISREVQRQITHIPERTQRLYGRIANVKSTRNFAIGARFFSRAIGTRKHGSAGNAVFEFDRF